MVVTAVRTGVSGRLNSIVLKDCCVCARHVLIVVYCQRHSILLHHSFQQVETSFSIYKAFQKRGA